MGLNFKTIDSIAKYAEKSGVKTVLQTKPTTVLKVDIGSFSLLTSDTVALRKAEPQFFAKNELVRIKQAVQRFLNEKVYPQINPPLSPKILFSKGIDIGGHGCCYPSINAINISHDVLLNPDFSKVISTKTGKCIDDPKLLVQLTGDKNYLIKKIIKYGLSDTKIVPLSKAERLNSVKETALHETVHSAQFAHMVQHEDIGLKRFSSEMLSAGGAGSVKKWLGKKLYQATWQPLLKEQGSISRDSDLGAKTLKQFEDLLAVAKEKDFNKRYILYQNASHEREAYQVARVLSEKFNLLL